MPVIRAVIADVMFSLPVIKNVLSWGGCHPASMPHSMSAPLMPSRLAATLFSQAAQMKASCIVHVSSPHFPA